MSDGTDRGAPTDEQVIGDGDLLFCTSCNADVPVYPRSRDFLCHLGHQVPVPEDVEVVVMRRRVRPLQAGALRALSPAEPSPDIAALLDELVQAAMYSRDEKIKAARAAVDAHLAALLARLTAAERDAERMDWLSQRTTDVLICPPGNHDGQPDHWFIDAENNNVPGVYREALTLRAAIDAARAALSPSGDTRGEQPAQEQDA